MQVVLNSLGTSRSHDADEGVRPPTQRLVRLVGELGGNAKEV